MNKQTNLSKRKNLFGFWRQLHRYSGITAASLVIILCITGLLIQHGDIWELDQQYLPNTWANQLYNITPPSILAYPINNSYIIHDGTRLYLDTKPLAGEYSSLQGAITTEFGFAAVVNHQLLLLDQTGKIIELLSDASLPEPLNGVVTNTEQILFQGSKQVWQPDSNWLNWQVYPIEQPKLQQAVELPEQLAQSIENQQSSVSWERLLLDLHSGRLFGKVGILIMDLATFALLILAGSGLWLWWRSRGRL